MELPCPPMNLVSECTTMSAPCTFGWHRYGVASVLSTISGTPASLAIAETAGRSMTMPPGLAIDSQKRALVLGEIAAAKVSGRVASAHATFQPKLLKAWLNWFTEPP